MVGQVRDKLFKRPAKKAGGVYHVSIVIETAIFAAIFNGLRRFIRGCYELPAIWRLAASRPLLLEASASLI